MQLAQSHNSLKALSEYGYRQPIPDGPPAQGHQHSHCCGTCGSSDNSSDTDESWIEAAEKLIKNVDELKKLDEIEKKKKKRKNDEDNMWILLALGVLVFVIVCLYYVLCYVGVTFFHVFYGVGASSKSISHKIHLVCLW